MRTQPAQLRQQLLLGVPGPPREQHPQRALPVLRRGGTRRGRRPAALVPLHQWHDNVLEALVPQEGVGEQPSAEAARLDRHAQYERIGAQPDRRRLEPVSVTADAIGRVVRDTE